MMPKLDKDNLENKAILHSQYVNIVAKIPNTGQRNSAMYKNYVTTKSIYPKKAKDESNLNK